MIIKKSQNGFSVLEMLIAFAILITAVTAAILILFGGQSTTTDAQTNQEAVYKAQKILEDARASASGDFGSVNTTATASDDIYTKRLSVSDLTPCVKSLTSEVLWNMEGRPQQVRLTTELTSLDIFYKTGEDCATVSSTSSWNNPQRFSSETINPGKTTSIDALKKIVYLGADKTPFFYIADATHAVFCASNPCGLLVSFTNGFKLKSQVNSLEAITDPISGENYVFVALASASKQLAVINVSDIHKPFLAAVRSLSPCVAGSYPEGWRLRYYDKKLYLTTRETAGPELHIFDVSDPANPSEFPIGSPGCKGLELGDTVNDLAVQEKTINGVVRTFVYLATDESDKELRVFEATSPLGISEVAAADQNLPGAQNGLSLFLVSDKLYLGRQSASGPDLYVYGVSHPLSGLDLLGSQDIGTSVIQIRIAGQIAFLATTKSNQEFQVWNISSPSGIFLVKAYNFGNIVDQGIDYEPNFVYATGNATPNFQILYSP